MKCIEAIVYHTFIQMKEDRTMDHKKIAAQLRDSRFHTYPSGSTARSQSIAMIRDLNAVLNSVNDHDNLPPWVIMKLSEAANSIRSVSNYLTYHSQKG